MEYAWARVGLKVTVNAFSHVCLLKLLFFVPQPAIFTWLPMVLPVVILGHFLVLSNSVKVVLVRLKKFSMVWMPPVVKGKSGATIIVLSPSQPCVSCG